MKYAYIVKALVKGVEITKYRNCSNYEFCIWTFRQIMSHQYRINQNIWKTKKPKDVKGWTNNQKALKVMPE